jgi:prevent-host-death family protein
MPMPRETRMKLTDTKQQLSQVVNQVAQGDTRGVVEKSGLAVAAIISVKDYQRFVEMDAEREERSAAMGRISDALPRFTLMSSKPKSIGLSRL